MTTTIKWKLLGILASILVSLYLLIPTLFGFSEKIEQAQRDGKELPSYMNLFPKKGVNLGLDLRGGLYVELDVDLNEALKNRLNVLTLQVEKSLETDEKLKDVTLQSNDVNHQVSVTVSQDKRSAFMEKLRSDFGDVFEISPDSTANSLVLRLSQVYIDHLRDMTLKQALEAVRNRVDRYGVAEASIQLQGADRIIVEIPGVKDPERVINIMRKTGLLEFKLVNDDVKEADLSTWIKEARQKEKLGDGYSKEEVDKINAAIADKLPKDFEMLFEVERDPVTKEIVNGVPYVVSKRSDVTGDMLRNAQVGITNNEPHVSLSFNKIGTKNFGDLTKENVGKRLAIVLDGFVTKAPVIQTAILSGDAQITLGYGNYQSLMQEADDLALMLREGALPATLTVATKTVIGPSLGADSIRSGIMSMFIATLVIVLFMVIYYRLGGLLADAALIVNVLFLFAILALLQASLSLPGIAGIVLTMGMAVDANVIIFERMREERRLGKTARLIVDAGYSHAMSAIVDSNLTTLIAGIVLYQFGTGPIKGFATTLMIGIVTTMVTAVFMTRVVYDYLIYVKKIDKVSI